jgi:hypothetical protein
MVPALVYTLTLSIQRMMHVLTMTFFFYTFVLGTSSSNLAAQ